MVLRISGEEVQQMAIELAERTEESIEEAVSVAIRERLERRREFDVQVEAVMEIADQCAEIIRGSGGKLPTQQEINDWLYDEHGLPK